MAKKEKVLEGEKKEDLKNDVEVLNTEKNTENENVAGTEKTVSPKECNHISVVIPYCKELAQGKELLYALRSWQKHVCFGINMVVIGDREDWFSEEITFIEHQCLSDTPQVDIVQKLQLALASPEVTECFIWTSDHTYLVNPISLAHIELPKVTGELAPWKHAGTFATNMEITGSLLKKEHLPILNYDTHTPVLFNKELLTEMFVRFPELQSRGYLLPTIYFNSLPFRVHPFQLDWKIDQFLLPIVSANPDEKKVLELLVRKVFLNNSESGYSQWLEQFLEQLFPEPSDFEE